MNKSIKVVAALIWEANKNGKSRFLICQRPAHKNLGLLWEFVGGKVEVGETKAQALVRECQEELGIHILAEDIFAEVTHQYPEQTVHLTLFESKIISGIPRNLEHNDIRWITPEEIDHYTFCPADVEILERIKRCFL